MGETRLQDGLMNLSGLINLGKPSNKATDDLGNLAISVDPGAVVAGTNNWFLRQDLGSAAVYARTPDQDSVSQNQLATAELVQDKEFVSTFHARLTDFAGNVHIPGDLGPTFQTQAGGASGTLVGGLPALHALGLLGTQIVTTLETDELLSEHGTPSTMFSFRTFLNLVPLLITDRAFGGSTPRGMTVTLYSHQTSDVNTTLTVGVSDINGNLLSSDSLVRTAPDPSAAYVALTTTPVVLPKSLVAGWGSFAVVDWLLQKDAGSTDTNAIVQFANLGVQIKY